jgi:splicing factor 3B subunit 5
MVRLLLCSAPKLIIHLTEANIFFQADKLRAQQQLEALQARYVGTGHADTTRFEWTSNIQRDSYASYIGHPPLLSYMAIGMGECREKVRAQMVEVSSL